MHDVQKCYIQIFSIPDMARYFTDIYHYSAIFVGLTLTVCVPEYSKIKKKVGIITAYTRDSSGIGPPYVEMCVCHIMLLLSQDWILTTANILVVKKGIWRNTGVGLLHMQIIHGSTHFILFWRWIPFYFLCSNQRCRYFLEYVMEISILWIIKSTESIWSDKVVILQTDINYVLQWWYDIKCVPYRYINVVIFAAAG